MRSIPTSIDGISTGMRISHVQDLFDKILYFNALQEPSGLFILQEHNSESGMIFACYGFTRS